jgi:hypothetical protein
VRAGEINEKTKASDATKKECASEASGFKIKMKTHSGVFPKGHGALSSEGLSMIFQAGLLAIF